MLPTTGRTEQREEVPSGTTALRERRSEYVADLFREAAEAAPSERELVRRKIVLEYLDVAHAIARRYSGHAQEWGDIRQVAYVGLVKAVRRFDAAKGDDFVSFAVPTIAGEIKRHLRDNGWFIRPPRHIQELHSALLSEIPRMAQVLGRQPRTRDLAQSLNESPEAVAEALGCQENLHPVSLDVPVRDSDSVLLADTIGTADRGLERAELVATLRAACRHLTARERRILYLRFLCEQTQTEIAGELGVTQMQVSRLLSQILGHLRNELSGGAELCDRVEPPDAALTA